MFDPTVTAMDAYLTYKAASDELTITQKEVMEVFGFEPKTASALLQTFLRTQKTGGLKNFLYRVPGTRTTNAVWTFGSKSDDVRQVVKQFESDQGTRINELSGHLNAVQTLNPHARRAVGVALTKFAMANEAFVKAVTDALS